jgi:NADPH:quinone reductase
VTSRISARYRHRSRRPAIGIGEDGYRRSFAALKRGGLLCAYGYSMEAAVAWWQAPPHLLDKPDADAASRLVPGRPGALFGLLETGNIRPRVAERISFDEVAEAHRRLEAGGLEGKLVLCPELRPRRDRVLP